MERGFTHALVMDADGQHPAGSIAEFMAASQANPDALVLGKPIFPANIPPERLHGRKLSVGLVRFELFGAGIDDPLFGFRIYPLAPLLGILGPRRGGRRYDFDTEAAVRLGWAGVRPVNLAAPVRYFSREDGGVSHFHYVRDNLTLVWMHTRLITELLLWRWPALLGHRRRWRTAAGALALVLLTLALPAAAQTAPDELETAVTQAELVEPDSPAWADLLEKFAAQPDTRARFLEKRVFPVRKKPVELAGVVRVSRQHGLSLQYLEPEVRTIVLDDRGVLLRDVKGARTPPADPRVDAVNQALLHILRFDFAALREDFEIRGQRDNDEWTLVLRPRSPAIQRTLGQISVAGENAVVRWIELRRSPKQFIEIAMSDVEQPVEFSAADLARHFRP